MPSKKQISYTAHLADLFRIMEITRSQVQYGYVMRGIQKADLSDLASHHYLVSFMAWQLARAINRNGGELNIEKVFEFGMTHDLGELFGGDISLPYAMKNKKARTHAKAFEAENQSFFSQYFGPDKKHFKELTGEIMDAYADEALVVKIADYVECMEYLQYMNKLSSTFDISLTQEKLATVVKRFKNNVARVTVEQFIDEWFSGLCNKDAAEILFA